MAGPGQSDDEENNEEFELPDDAPEAPEGFDEPVYISDEEPPRYDCLVCDETYFLEDELREHVVEHSHRDLYTALRGENFPTVAWFVPDEVPFTAYTRDAARYALNVLDAEGVTPLPVERLANGQDPLTGDDVESTHPSTLVRKQPHDKWGLYELIRKHVPDEYERSPVYDDAGYPEPAATINCLQPDDVVAWRAQGWSQSLGTPRGQTRDSFSNDDWWEGEGIVTGVEDSRTGAGIELYEDSIDRTVTVYAKTDLFEERVSVTLEPRTDGDVVVKLRPQVRQDAAVKRKGHGGPGYTKARITREQDVDRFPWFEKDED